MPLSLRSLFARRFGCAILFAGLLSSTLGCGDDVKLVPVSGRVTIDGKPLTSGWVAFKPDKSKGNNFGGELTGEVNSEGEYTIQHRGKPGAPLGAYKVTVSSTGPTTPDNTKPNTKSLIRTNYLQVATTPLAVEVVKEPAPGAYDLKLSP